MATVSGHIVPSVPVNGWLVVGRMIGEAIAGAGRTPADVGASLDLSVADLQWQIKGEPVLSTFELERLARELGTTTGAWFYDDRAALFRGQDARGAAAEAERIGRELMLRHLGLEAACG